MILEMIVNNRKRELKELKKHMPLPVITKKAFEHLLGNKARDLYSILKSPGLSLIAEMKQCELPHMIIRENYNPALLALAFEKAGAQAVSVTTEDTFFKGSSDHIAQVKALTKLPVIRKDFIFDEWQICESRILGADAIFLFASLFEPFELASLISRAEALEIQCIVVVRSRSEIDSALRSGARMICVSGRDTQTFETNIMDIVSMDIALPKETVHIAAGGIRSPEDVHMVAQTGADAVVIGSALMRARSVENEINRLMSGTKKAI